MKSKVNPLGDFLRNFLVLKIRSRTELFPFLSVEVSARGGDAWSNYSCLVFMRRATQTVEVGRTE